MRVEISYDIMKTRYSKILDELYTGLIKGPSHQKRAEIDKLNYYIEWEFIPTTFSQNLSTIECDEEFCNDFSFKELKEYFETRQNVCWWITAEINNWRRKSKVCRINNIPDEVIMYYIKEKEFV